MEINSRHAAQGKHHALRCQETPRVQLRCQPGLRFAQRADGSRIVGPMKKLGNYLTGVLTMVTAPASSGGSGPSGEEVLSFRAEFFNHVRFNTDKLDINIRVFTAGSWPSFPLIELRATGL